MKAGPKEQYVTAWAIPIARGLVAAIVALSFLAFLVPLGSASAGSAGLMACCIGKPGHESGSCSTGLLESPRQPQSEPNLSSRQSAPRKVLSIDVTKIKSGAGAGEHCSLHTQSASENNDSPNETSEPDPASQIAEVQPPLAPSSETEELASEPGSVTSERIGPGKIDALSSPCPMECGTCSVSYTRRPRPRDQSTFSYLPRPRLPTGRRFSSGAFQQIRDLHAKFLQLHPRAPPASLL